MERLQKVIANAGICSRRKAEELIKTGHVTVNGELVTQMGVTVKGTDSVIVDGVKLKNTNKEYILLNKPRAVITSTKDPEGRKTVMDFIDTDKRLYPVGRLDYDTTGLVLLTNDGELMNLLTHPKNEVDKVYIAKVEGIATKEEIRALEKGIVVDKVHYGKAKVHMKKVDKKHNTCILELTIHEGKNHEIKNMLEGIRHPVIRLHRERIAFLDCTGLNSGDYRELSIHEVKKLYSYANKK